MLRTQRLIYTFQIYSICQPLIFMKRKEKDHEEQHEGIAGQAT